MQSKWFRLAIVTLLFCIFSVYQVWSQTRPSGGVKLSTAPAGPRGPERILNFHAEIAVHGDSSLTVTESVQVVALGKEIKRGIYRDFPVRYRKKDGKRLTVPFEVAAVLKDGRPETYHVVTKGDYKRVYMGRKDVFLKPGAYTYTLVYRTGKQLGSFKDRNELYWNVTGNEWSFPIEKASARVKLPKGVPAGKVKYTAYTGPKGAKGNAYRARTDEGARVCFTTTEKLRKGEGLTIVVTWPKGFVTRPEKE